MTKKQIERIQAKIKKVRAALVAEKRKYGAFDDSRGLRYLPLGYYIQLLDYKGGLTYTRWFKKNFPDDIGYPDFLFEWTIVFFKTEKLNNAEKKAIETYFANTYLFDKFFNRPIIQIDKYESSNLESPDFTNYFNYSSEQEDLKDFSDWLKQFEQTDRFKLITSKFLDLQKRLKHEKNRETRSQLLDQSYQLIKEI